MIEHILNGRQLFEFICYLVNTYTLSKKVPQKTLKMSLKVINYPRKKNMALPDLFETCKVLLERHHK